MEWLDNKIQIVPPKRPKKLTATRFATILGLNPWSTPFEVWCEITRTYQKPFEDTIYTIAGKTIEPKQAEYMKNTYSKESFGGEISFVRPSTMAKGSVAMPQWIAACKQAEFSYFAMLDYGCTPQEARSVLPNSTKTEVVMTANMREWRHFLRLRTAPAAHPDMREVAKMLLAEMQTRYPAFFEDFEV